MDTTISFALYKNQTELTNDLEQARNIHLWLNGNEAGKKININADNFSIEICKEAVRGAARLNMGVYKEIQPGLHLYGKEADEDGFGLHLGVAHVLSGIPGVTIENFPLGWAELVELNGIVRPMPLRDLRSYWKKEDDAFWGRESGGTPQDRAYVHDFMDGLLKGRSLFVYIAPFRPYLAAIIAKNFSLDVEKAQANYQEVVSQQRIYARQIAPVVRDHAAEHKPATNNLPVDTTAKTVAAIIFPVVNAKGVPTGQNLDVTKLDTGTSVMIYTPSLGGKFSHGWSPRWNPAYAAEFTDFSTKKYAVRLMDDAALKAALVS